MRLLTFLEETEQDNKLGGGAGVLIYVPSTGRMLIQQRGEHPDDKDSGKYDFFGGTLEEGETAEECARREAKEEGQIEFPEGSLEEIGAFSSTEGGDWDGEPYHVFMFSTSNEFRPKIQAEEVAKAGWIHPSELNDQNSTNRVVKALAHEKVRDLLRVDVEESAPVNPTLAEQDEDEGWWYHVTSLANMPSIASRGLQPGAGSAKFGGGYAGHSTGRIFFATDSESAQAWFSKVQQNLELSSDNPFEQTAVILRVDPDYFFGEDDPQVDEPGTRDVGESKFVTTPVDPEEIEVWSPGDQWHDRGWHPVGSYFDQPNPSYGHDPWDYQEMDPDYYDEEDQERWPEWEAVMSESRLDEKTFSVAKDVDFIWNTYYKDFFRDLLAGEDPEDILVRIPDHRLPSRDAKKASNIIPVMIELQTAGPGNYYIPKKEGETHATIKITPNSTVIYLLRSSGGDVENALLRLPEHQHENFKNEASGLKLKASIAHELSHWMDDAFHAQHITGELKKRREQLQKSGKDPARNIPRSPTEKKYGDEYIGPTEINAQIHQVKELKRKLRKRWDLLRFEDVLGYDAALRATANNLKGKPELYARWKKAMLQRMAREGLLGKRMTGLTEAVYPYFGHTLQGEWFHGMASSSRAFVRSKGSHPSNIGIWLTNSKDIAGKFAQQASRRMVGDEPIVVTTQIRAENPLVCDTYADYLELWREFNDSERMRRSLMRKGHDSIIIAQSDTDFGGEHRMDIAVFKPSDLKVLEKERLEPEKNQ